VDGSGRAGGAPWAATGEITTPEPIRRRADVTAAPENERAARIIVDPLNGAGCGGRVDGQDNMWVPWRDGDETASWLRQAAWTIRERCSRWAPHRRWSMDERSDRGRT